jgi:hypothetical protein
LEYSGNRGDPFTNNSGNYADRNRNFGYGGGGPSTGLGMPERRAEARGLGIPEQPNFGIDESRRGIYNNRASRAPEQPVRLNRDSGNDL